LRKKDFKEAERVAGFFFPESKDALKYLKEFKKSEIFRKDFSFGHSGDFDILMLYLLTRMSKPDIVVETGVASGRSSSAILFALKENNKGKLYSIDLPKYYREKEPKTYITDEGKRELRGFVPNGKGPGWLVPDYLRNRWEFIAGDSKVELPKLLRGLRKVDIFYHDSDHSYQTMMFEFKTVWPLIQKGGYLVSDDIKWNASFYDFIKKHNYDLLHIYRNLGVIKK
jgi:predicted O-methyltransferase YrrM